jgi:hypothetical protein
VANERELSCVFPHQIFETLQRNNFPKSEVDRGGARFHAKNFLGFVG